jgi:hypothetical protein
MGLRRQVVIEFTTPRMSLMESSIEVGDAIPPTSALCSGVARNPWSSLGGNELLPRGKGKVGIPPWKRKLGDCGGFFSWKMATVGSDGLTHNQQSWESME